MNDSERTLPRLGQNLYYPSTKSGPLPAAMYDYREYCPIAKASQLLGERWTLLIIRELLCGTTRFNQLRRYLPRISPTLLKSRLSLLEAEGIVARVRSADRDSYEYALTASGRALESVLMTLGQWATEWQFDKFKNDEIFIDTMMRDLELTLVSSAMPGSRTVLKFLLDVDEQIEAWYVVIEGGQIEACDDERGFDVDVYLNATPRVICDILIRKIPLKTAMTDGRLKITGSRAHINAIDDWFGLAPYV